MAMPPPPPPMSQATLEDGLRPGGLPIPPPSEEVPLFIVFMNAVNTVSHLLIGGVAITAFICINIIDNLPQLTAHVYLTVIGYVFLMSQAILSLNPRMGWKNNFLYPQKTKVYWFLQVIGSTLAVIGAGMGIAASERLFSWNNRHLSTSHQIVGFIAMMFTSVSLLGGIVQLVATNRVNTKIYKAIYACVSTCTLILAYVVIILAIEKFRGYLLDTSTNLAISFSVLAVVGMLTMWIANFVAVGKFVI